MKRIVVTGASGFIGRAVVDYLLQKDYFVYAVVRSEEKRTAYGWNKNLSVLECDLKQAEKLLDLIQEKRIDSCIHFAWGGVSGSGKSEYELQIENILNSCKLMDVCGALQCKRFIFASSIAELECMKYMTIGDTKAVSDLYSAAKLSADSMSKILAKNYGIEYISAIISNAYGVGEVSPRLINSMLRKFIHNEAVFLTEGKHCYDFIFIDDVARAFYLISEKGRKGKAYYIGSNHPRAVRDFLMEAGAVVGKQQLLQFGKLDYHGIPLEYDKINLYELQADTGFTPEVPFREGIRLTYDWLKNRKSQDR
ncbi:MAG: NAD(P)-dependent oxidoreductase [Lachnospiraceae bacterium]